MALSDLAPDVWIQQQLSGDAQLAALVTSIQPHPAPLGCAFPIVTYAPQTPARDTNVSGGVRVMSDGTWLVRVIGQTRNLLDLAAAAERIDAVLQATAGDSEFGYLYGVLRISPFRMSERLDGVDYLHLGGVYRVWYSS